MSIIYSRLVGMSALSALLLFNVALIPAVASFANVSVHCLTSSHTKLPLSILLYSRFFSLSYSPSLCCINYEMATAFFLQSIQLSIYLSV